MLWLGACVEPQADAGGPPPGPNKQMEALAVPELPEGAVLSHFDFESRVSLEGYKLDQTSVKPGGRVKITFYWRGDNPPQGDWHLFTHLLDSSGRQLANFDAVGPLRGAGSISSWQRGKLYVDEQEIDLPRDLDTPFVTLAVGVWTGVVRLDLIGGVNDDKNRALVVRLPVTK
ncbi:MAG: hypothetical protein AB7K71_09460 [Polyangiaceae bacterium]